VRQISARTGLGLKFVSKDMFLSKALKGLEPLLIDECVLKGGTAVSRTGYMTTPRFSEDVDLDLYTNKDRNVTGKSYLELLKRLEGFNVEGPRVQRGCLRYDAFFENHFGEKDRVRIELALRQGRPPDDGGAPKTLLQSQFTLGQACVIKTYSKVGLLVRKVDALANRMDGKDPFDIWGMWERSTDVNVITAELDAYLKVDKRNSETILSNAMRNVERMGSDRRMIANSANHFIPRSERPDWGMLLNEVEAILQRIQKGI
jgi:predicted nucleotidyltransferase component of viral defense system